MTQLTILLSNKKKLGKTELVGACTRCVKRNINYKIPLLNIRVKYYCVADDYFRQNRSSKFSFS